MNKWDQLLFSILIVIQIAIDTPSIMMFEQSNVHTVNWEIDVFQLLV
jgi:hypothetical protein